MIRHTIIVYRFDQMRTDNHYLLLQRGWTNICDEQKLSAPSLIVGSDKLHVWDIFIHLFISYGDLFSYSLLSFQVRKYQISIHCDYVG